VACGNCGKCGITGTILSHLNRDKGRIFIRTHRLHFKHVLSYKNTSLKRYFKSKRSFTKCIHSIFKFFTLRLITMEILQHIALVHVAINVGELVDATFTGPV